MKLTTKVALIVAAAAGVSALIAVQVSWNEVYRQGQDDLVLKSQAILDQLEGTRDYVASQGGLKEYIESIVQKYPTGEFPEEIKMNILKRVPIFSSIKVGKEQSARSGYDFRVFSPEPRRKENLASASEMTIFDRFEKDPNLKELVDKSDKSVVVYRPVRLAESQGCLHCHGNPSASPFKNGKDVLGFKMENWSDGKLHGVFAITSSMDNTKKATMASVTSIILFSFGGLVLSVLIAVYILKKPMSALRNAVESIKNSSAQLSEASTEISKASQNLSSSSTHAAASIEETSASLEELTGMVKLNTENSQSAKDISMSARDTARTGEAQMGDLIDSMKEVAKSAKKIEEITSVIDDIAFQTNLLALNAAVEAARAGEQGRGFAIVAGAVRTLAQKSADSAKEISELISTSVTQINQSYERAVESGKTLELIVNESEKVSAINSDIAQASAEQNVGIQQIAQAIHELDKITQGNAASSEETAAASVELSSQSGNLDDLIESVEAVVNGAKKAS